MQICQTYSKNFQRCPQGKCGGSTKITRDSGKRRVPWSQRFKTEPKREAQILSYSQEADTVISQDFQANLTESQGLGMFSTYQKQILLSHGICLGCYSLFSMKMILSVTTHREQQNLNILLYMIQVSNYFSSTNVSLVT